MWFQWLATEATVRALWRWPTSDEIAYVWPIPILQSAETTQHCTLTHTWTYLPAAIPRSALRALRYIETNWSIFHDVTTIDGLYSQGYRTLWTTRYDPRNIAISDHLQYIVHYMHTCIWDAHKISWQNRGLGTWDRDLSQPFRLWTTSPGGYGARFKNLCDLKHIMCKSQRPTRYCNG